MGIEVPGPRWLLAALIAAPCAVACPSDLHADPVESANDFRVALSDARETRPIPSDASRAAGTFDERAAFLLEAAACVDPATDKQITIYNTPFDSASEGKGLEAWGADALARLAYTGGCSFRAGPQSARERYADVDRKLAAIQVASSLGSTIHASVLGFTIEREGDLDTGLKELLPIAYLYPHKIPGSYQLLIGLLQSANSGPPLGFHVIDSTGKIPPGIAFRVKIPESENHMLLSQSERYLINQIVHKQIADPLYDNAQNGMRAVILRMLHGILTSDFMEYNSKPYQRYSLNAVENLLDFAEDPVVATTARMVLDWAAAKFAVSSSMLRRSSPYRRKGDHEGHLFSGSYADEQFCRFLLYTGQMQTISRVDSNGRRTYEAPSQCAHARQVVGKYRPPEVVIDLAIRKDRPYLQRFSGGNNYYGTFFGNAVVPGGVEIYDNEGPFLIASGGVPRPNALPAPVTIRGVTDNQYATDQANVGIALPTVLIPYDAPSASADVPQVDRAHMVQIAGVGQTSSNLCVAPGFACGANPTIPADLCPPGGCDDGPWQFASLSSVPTRTYVAVFSRAASSAQPTPDLASLGVLEAVPGSRFADFDEFKRRVKALNGDGQDVVRAQCTGTPARCTWDGSYRKTDGSRLSYRFEPSLSLSGNTPSVASYPIAYTGAPASDASKWDLADGPVQADRSGLIVIQDPFHGRRCVLDDRDVDHPKVHGCSRAGMPVFNTTAAR
jgi:hypothetical protein